MFTITDYDIDDGTIFFISGVLPHLECKVNDAIRTVEDAARAPELLGCHFPTPGDLYTPHDVGLRYSAMVDEAIAVSDAVLSYLETAMKNRFRETQDWITCGDSLRKYQAARSKRRQEFLSN